jgi:hypothetical protein
MTVRKNKTIAIEIIIYLNLPIMIIENIILHYHNIFLIKLLLFLKL